MTEDAGEAAEERRRAVREELERRGAALVARRKKSDGSPPSSFDSIVDNEGRLLDLDDVVEGGDGPSSPGTLANSTAVDLGMSSLSPSSEAGQSVRMSNCRLTTRLLPSPLLLLLS